MLPIRCFTCNKVLGCYNDVLDKFKIEHSNPDYKEFFEKYQISRYCCRKVFLTNVDIFQYNPSFTQDNIICKKESEVIKILRAE